MPKVILVRNIPQTFGTRSALASGSISHLQTETREVSVEELGYLKKFLHNDYFLLEIQENDSEIDRAIAAGRKWQEGENIRKAEAERKAAERRAAATLAAQRRKENELAKKQALFKELKEELGSKGLI